MAEETPDAQPAAPRLTELISPQDYRLYSIPRGQEEAYRKAGYFQPQNNINREKIHEQFSGWTGLPRSYLMSTLGGVPFAKTLIAGVSSKEQAKAWKESFDAAAREHPYLDIAGRVTGTLGGAAAIAGGVGAVGGALGAGGALAAEGAATAAGAEGAVLGEGLAGAAEAGSGLAAGEGAAASAAQTGANAAARTLNLGGSGIRGAMIEGAATNATLGHIARIDDSALAHAADPEGKEKIQWMINQNDLIDAAFGAALPGALGAFAKGLGYVGKKLDTAGLKAMRDAFTKADAAESVAQQGRMGDLTAKLDDIMANGRSNPRAYAKARVLNAGRDMQDVIEATEKTVLDPEETMELKYMMRKILGKNNRIYPRTAKFWAKEEWNVTDLKQFNEKLYSEIDFDNLHLRPGQNEQYMLAASKSTDGMGRIFQRIDPTNSQALAQRWMMATQDYSNWMLSYKALKTGQAPATAKEILASMFRTGGTAGAASIVGAFSANPLTAAATGAGYAALGKINAYHYGAAAKFFGKHMLSIDKRLTDAVEAGLYGAPSVLHTLTTRKEYNDTASKLSALRNDPATAFSNIRTSMHEAGYPEHIADDAALAQHSQTQFLANKLPSRMTAPDVASRGHGDPVQQRRLMGQVRTMRDPTYGILYPNKTNMEVLQQFYPNVLANTQQAVLSQLQRNPNLPAASKLWASRILGRPINNLSSPSFFATMDAARQDSAEREQQAQQMQGPQRKSTSSAGPATRLDELQGGAE